MNRSNGCRSPGPWGSRAPACLDNSFSASCQGMAPRSRGVPGPHKTPWATQPLREDTKKKITCLETRIFPPKQLLHMTLCSYILHSP